MSELDNIRNRLKKHRLTFVWLIYQLRECGITTDKTEISSVFAGSRVGTKADSIIQESVKILDDYEQGKVLPHDE